MQNGKAWLKKESRPYRKGIFFLTVLSVISVLFSLAFAYMVRYLVNSADEKDRDGLILFSIFLLALILFKIIFKTLDNFFSEKLRAKMYVHLRTRLYSKVLRSNYAKIKEYHSGELLNRLTSDVQEVAVDTVGLLPTLAGMFTQCFGAIVALLTLNWKFTLLYVVCGAIFGVLAALFRKQLKKAHKEVLQAEGDIRSYMQESIASMLTLKAYGAESSSTENAAQLSDVYYKKRMRRNVLRVGMNALFALLSNFGLILAIVLCSITIYRSPQADYGVMLSIILLLMQMQQPLTGFSSVIPVYYTRLASGERLAEVDSIAVDMETEETAKEDLYGKLTAISFETVDFSYKNEIILNGATEKINKGEIVCLTGASGSGKSTIFKLLLSVYKPISGRILLCGDKEDDVQELQASHRHLFAYVPQGDFLFSGTIYENLTCFISNKQNVQTEESIREALTIACAEFVYDLPQGLETVLYERGLGLSEGQLQRLAIARAILSKRPILLFDEATSALDEQTEKKLLENLKGLQGKTCLIVTHRPAALNIADRILSVENGKINCI